MTTGYPGTIDNFTNPTGANNLSDEPVLHHSQHANVNDAVHAIELELGTNAKGAATSVRARLEAIESAQADKLDASLFHQPFGVATLDAGGNVVEPIDASKVASGILGVARIPNLSGAKILGTGGGGAPIPVDAVPDLAASKTTSGTFAAARIPPLDGSVIATGTISAARLPTTVTSNANSKEVADVAAMNAIPVVDRVDGMIVTVRQPWSQYTYRADSATFQQTGGPGSISEPPVENYDDTSFATVSFTTFQPGAPVHSQVFTAPQSGKVYITYSSMVIITSGTGQGYIGCELRSGNVIGSGSIIDPIITQKCVATGGANGLRNGASIRYLVPGLTAGNQYHVRSMMTCSVSPAATMSIFYRRVLIEMVH
jgi:hypothetical protein